MLLLAACGSSSKPKTTAAASTAATTAAAATPTPIAVRGKATTVVVAPSTLAALAAQSIAIKAVAPARVGKVLRFPITGGHVSLAAVGATIDHGGGITLEHAGRSVTLRDFVLDTVSKTITASVGGLHLPVFDLDLSSLRRSTGVGGTLVLADVKLRVSAQTSASLTTLLGVPGLKAGQQFGVATMTIAVG